MYDAAPPTSAVHDYRSVAHATVGHPYDDTRRYFALAAEVRDDDLPDDRLDPLLLIESVDFLRACPALRGAQDDPRR